MNNQEADILKAIYQTPYTNQRKLADMVGHSLGVVNRSIQNLLEQGYLTSDMQLSEQSHILLQQCQPKRAIILAAGFGMRMVPIGWETPKAFLKIHDEYLIERQIRQLHEVGIQEIYIVVGFLKEKFEYLIDKYHVTLVVNRDYATKGNLHSLCLVAEHLDNAYIIPSDIWCERNPFHRHELYSWYMVSDLIDDDSEVRINRKSELVRVSSGDCGNTMIGISYLLNVEADKVRNNIAALCIDRKYDHVFWEEALYERDRMFVSACVMRSSDVVEINTYEQLRELDSDSEHLKSYAISVIQQTFEAENDEIQQITVLKKGMTNRSFLFVCKDNKYIMRIPGEGTEQLINRSDEAAVYRIIKDCHMSDDIRYINPENGYKITSYIEGARCCDPHNNSDLQKCMELLRKLHGLKLKVPHEFNICEKIDFYESLWIRPSVYQDYLQTKEQVFSLLPYIEVHAEEKVLTHIDAVPDNFLLFKNAEGQEEVRLIDWEYAAMQDPHVDIAMFCIYALYDKQSVDNLINIYFEHGVEEEIRMKIYCYISLCGLLWSNWCEYKSQLGVEFGEYSLRQYRYAKEYYHFAIEEIRKSEEGL